MIILGMIPAALACRKTSLPDRPELLPVQRIVVPFDAQSLPVSLVDSTELIVYPEGTTHRQSIAFRRIGDSLVAGTTDLAAGRWVAEIKIYAAKGQSAHPRQFYRTATVTLGTGPARIAAPGPVAGNDWKTRSILKHPIHGVWAMLPDDPTDSWFEIVVTDARWTRVYLRRIGRDDRGIVQAMKEYTKTLPGGTFRFENRIAFAAFAQTMATTAWDEHETGVVFTDASQQEAVLMHRVAR
jgi:hypothetical protein